MVEHMSNWVRKGDESPYMAGWDYRPVHSNDRNFVIDINSFKNGKGSPVYDFVFKQEH